MSEIKTIKVIREDLSGVDFMQGETVVVSINLKELPKDILTHLALHGLSQKVGDSYAGVKEAGEVVEKASAVKARLIEGNWQAVRASASPRATQLAEALARVYSKTTEEAVTAISKLSKDQIADLRKDASVSAALKTIAAERAAEKANKANKEIEGTASTVDSASLFG